MKYLFMFFLVIILTGCKEEGQIKYYKCNYEQLDIVEREAKICYDTSYFSTFCLDQAMAKHCDDIRDNK